MEITRRTKLLDLLDEYPQLEARIITLAPPFKNLKNPVLRRTVGQLATLEKIAQIGGLDADELVNSLRCQVGQEALVQSQAPLLLPERSGDDPEWICGEPRYVVDGVELLRQGEVPLLHVNALLAEMKPGEHLVLVTDFEPTPIMEAMEKQGRRVFHKAHPQDAGRRLTFIQAGG